MIDLTLELLIAWWPVEEETTTAAREPAESRVYGIGILSQVCMQRHVFCIYTQKHINM